MKSKKAKFFFLIKDKMTLIKSLLVHKMKFLSESYLSWVNSLKKNIYRERD